MKTYNRREIRKILRKNGWYLSHCTGGHAIYRKEGEKDPIVIGTRNCNKMVAQRLFKEFRLKI